MVVENIEFSNADDRAVLPAPLDLDLLKSMTLEERRNMLLFDTSDVIYILIQADIDKAMEIDAERDSIGVAAYPKAPSKSQPPPPKPKKAGSTEICPICKQSINSADLPDHMKLELRDPRHEKMVAAYQEKIRETNLVSDDQVAANLKRLTSVRTDIVGGDSVGVEQRLQFEEEKQREALRGKVIWDGKKQSVAAVTAKAQMMAHQPPAPTFNGIPPPPPSQAPGPPTKKPRLDPNAVSLSINISVGPHNFYSRIWYFRVQ